MATAHDDLRATVERLEHNLQVDPLPPDTVRLIGELLLFLFYSHMDLADITAELERKPTQVVNYVNQS